VIPLAQAVGGKAGGLARLVAAGLPVPEGVVFAPGEPACGADGLRAPFVVRSSAPIEDTAAPGVFLSLRGVTPDGLAAAVARVRASADSPAAIAYLARLGRSGAPLSVIVQEEIAGTPGTLYTRTPDDPASPAMLVESAGQVRLVPREAAEPLVALGLAAEAAIGAPADVEWVREAAGTIWLVQARPIHFAARAPDEILAAARALDPSRVWSWDAAHNPDPLSPAQAGLVARVADLGAHEPAVIAGYLYTAPRAGVSPTIRADELRAAFDDRLVPAWRARLDAARGRDLPAALAAYRDFYASYAGEWGVSLAAARRAHAAALATIGARAPAGAFPVAWDVLADLRVVTPPVRARGASLAEEIAALSEEDDVLFAEAQGLVRDALAALAAAHNLSLDDVCHLPLGDLSGGRAAAAEARRERARRATLTPPLRLLAGGVLDLPPGDAVLRGLAASPGRAQGEVGREILVATALVPGQYPDALEARALVLVHGGILSHGAALARELGIPCVAGCRGAEKLSAGEKVLVDGDLGTVVRL
jgi:phosphohistidine swiveling domain-containing protein